MQFPREIIAQLIPADFPPDQFVGIQASMLADSIEEPSRKRSYLWSQAIVNVASTVVTPEFGKVISFSGGFVCVSGENEEQNRQIKCLSHFSFGANALVMSAKPRPQMLRLIEIGRNVLPLVINFGQIVGHGIPTHPLNGTSSCWLISTNPRNNWNKGILTCRHVVETFPMHYPIGLEASIDHNSPSNGVLADIDICTIDAAIIEIDDSDWPLGLSSCPIRKAITAGDSAAFKGKYTSGQGTVLRVFQHPGYIGNLFGQRIFTDFLGVNGDSGALVSSLSRDEALGIYIGEVPDGRGGKEGIGQHLYQASEYFGFSTHL